MRTSSTGDLPSRGDDRAWPTVTAIASLDADQALDALGSRPTGLTGAEERRTSLFGPNAVRSPHASAWGVLVRQLRNPLLWLLLIAAGVSAVVGVNSAAPANADRLPRVAIRALALSGPRGRRAAGLQGC